MGIALLQNEQLPTFLPVNVIEELVTSTNDRCMVNLQQGLGVFWISHDVLESASITSSNKAYLTSLLQDYFSTYCPLNSLIREKQVYAFFVKYVQEVSSS